MARKHDSHLKTAVLADHKREGKVFVAPMNQVGPWSGLSWVSELLPELIWIGLLQRKYGLARGVKLATELSNSAILARLDDELIRGFELSRTE